MKAGRHLRRSSTRRRSPSAALVTAGICVLIVRGAVAHAAEDSLIDGPGYGGAQADAQGLAADQRPDALRDVGFDQRLDAQLPLAATFRDEVGAEVPLGKFFHGKPVIVSLAYFDCPMLCGVVLNGLASALRTLSFDAGNEFEVLTVSFDPKDTPESARKKKATYLERYHRAGAEQGWHFLTGDPVSIDKLTRAIGFRYAYDRERQQYAHAAGIVVATPEGKLARYFYGLEFSPRDLRLGLIEAAEEKIGSPIDQVLLFCFHYDPVTGRYGRTALGAVRIGGVLTLLAIFGSVGTMLWREAQRSRAAQAGARPP